MIETFKKIKNFMIQYKTYAPYFKFIKNLKILLKSWVMKIILKFIGLKIRKSFICYSMPDLKINGKSKIYRLVMGLPLKVRLI